MQFLANFIMFLISLICSSLPSDFPHSAFTISFESLLRAFPYSLCSFSKQSHPTKLEKTSPPLAVGCIPFTENFIPLFQAFHLFSQVSSLQVCLPVHNTNTFESPKDYYSEILRHRKKASILGPLPLLNSQVCLLHGVRTSKDYYAYSERGLPSYILILLC